jgi:hypothetical protein
MDWSELNHLHFHIPHLYDVRAAHPGSVGWWLAKVTDYLDGDSHVSPRWSSIDSRERATRAGLRRVCGWRSALAPLATKARRRSRLSDARICDQSAWGRRRPEAQAKPTTLIFRAFQNSDRILAFICFVRARGPPSGKKCDRGESNFGMDSLRSLQGATGRFHKVAIVLPRCSSGSWAIIEWVTKSINGSKTWSKAKSVSFESHLPSFQYWRMIHQDYLVLKVEMLQINPKHHRQTSRTNQHLLLLFLQLQIQIISSSSHKFFLEDSETHGRIWHNWGSERQGTYCQTTYLDTSSALEANFETRSFCLRREKRAFSLLTMAISIVNQKSSNQDMTSIVRDRNLSLSRPDKWFEKFEMASSGFTFFEDPIASSWASLDMGQPRWNQIWPAAYMMQSLFWIRTGNNGMASDGPSNRWWAQSGGIKQGE